jgi:hypothetical protein
MTMASHALRLSVTEWRSSSVDGGVTEPYIILHGKDFSSYILVNKHYTLNIASPRLVARFFVVQ